MIDESSLREALLQLGLEDLIALPEIAKAEEIVQLGDVQLQQIQWTLLRLLEEERIQVWSAHWREEPHRTSSAQAKQFLKDPQKYEFNSESDLRQRTYYINVDVLRN